MKKKHFHKPNLKDGMTNLSDAGGLILGGMISAGADGIVPIDNNTTRKGLIAGTGLLLSTAFTTKTNLSRVGKNFFLGMAVKQVADLILGAGSSLPEADGTTVNKFLHDMFETGGGSITTSSKSPMGLKSGYRFYPNRPVSPLSVSTLGHKQTTSNRLSFSLT